MLKVFLIAISVCGSYCNAQVCLQTVSPVNYLTFPTPYNNMSVITHGTADCSLFRNTHFQCDYTIILGDRVMVPSPPDLTSSTYLRHFLAWQRGSPSPYVDFDLTGATSGVTAIELSFLNSPANRISLPDITLSRVQDGNPNPIPSQILSNQDLTQTDNQIRTVIVRPLISQAGLNLRINFAFTNFHDFDWIFLSEVRFCIGPPPLFTPNIVFLAPVSNIVQPSVDDLRRGSTELVCTVSNEGSYTWQWERDNSVIGNSGDFRITIGDGSRTTRLTISNLDFNDAGEYNCTVTTLDRVHTNSSVQEIQFPEFIVTASDTTGYQHTGEVTLTCELHSYQFEFSPPVWLDTSGNSISNSSKYTITISDGKNLQNGTSVIVNLTIHSLTSADEGNYTCRGPNESFSVAFLSVVEIVDMPSSPPTNTEPSTTTDSRDITTTDSRDITTTDSRDITTTDSRDITTTDSRDTGDTITIAAAVGSITIVIISLGILTVILVLVKIQQNKNKTQNNISYCPYNVNLTVENDFYTLEPTASMSSKLQALDKTDSQDGGSPRESIDISIEPLYQDIKLCQEHVSESVRKTTNSTEPNLMKVVGENFEEMLDSNPLYDRAPNKAILDKGMEDNPMYMERSQLNLCEGCMEENPIYMVEDDEHSFYTASVLDNAEPVYNKAINPHYLSHTVSGENRICNDGVIADNYNSLFPFIEPVYAIPDRRSTEPVYSKAINQENFKPDSEVLSSISSSTEPVYSEAINPSIFTPDMDKSDTSLLPYGPVYALPEKIKLKKYFTVMPENVDDKSQLGIGEFGEVVLAETVGLSEADLKLGNSTDKSARILVAVKKLRDQADTSMRESFEKEIKFMSGLSDENIVRLLAVCDKEPKFIVIEYMENGDLYQYLNQRELATFMKEIGTNQITVSTLLYMGVQIASGMRYLASLKFVHRDLASRNCLVSKDHRVKISDFGMSRNLYESVYYRVKGRAMLPIRWMAMECFYGRFSEKTDIWSYGITLWEIFTLGKSIPYNEISDQQVIEEAIHKKERTLLAKPEACPDDVYVVMLRCWEYRPNDRADFKEIFTSLSNVHSINI